MARKPGSSPSATWIFRIAYNACISKIRKNRKYKVQENIENYDFSFIEKGYESIEQREKTAMLEAAIDELDSDSKAIILMFYYHDKSVEEIGEITSLSRENVKIKLFRARKRLMHLLEKKFKLTKTDWI